MFGPYFTHSDQGEDSSISGSISSASRPGSSLSRTRRLGLSKRPEPIRYGALSRSQEENDSSDAEANEDSIPVSRNNLSAANSSGKISSSDNSWLTESVEYSTEMSASSCKDGTSVERMSTRSELSTFQCKNDGGSIGKPGKYPYYLTPSNDRHGIIAGNSTQKRNAQNLLTSAPRGNTTARSTNNLITTSASKHHGIVTCKQETPNTFQGKQNTETNPVDSRHEIYKLLDAEIVMARNIKTPALKHDTPRCNFHSHDTPRNNNLAEKKNSEQDKENVLCDDVNVHKNGGKKPVQPGVKNEDFVEPRQPLSTLNPVNKLNTWTPNKIALQTTPRQIEPLSAKKTVSHISLPITNNTYTPLVAQIEANQSLIINNKQYLVLSTLGRGGSSVVYQGLDQSNHKLLAIKCVDLKSVEESIAEGYMNEIQLLSQLQFSRSIIKLFDYEYHEIERKLYMVMEKGDTDLATLLKGFSKTERPSNLMIAYYWSEMLKAVKVIHDQGIIHSDLKPANFLLVSGCLKLIDFGIASSIQTDMTSVVKDSQLGTYNYMSPEAIQDTQTNMNHPGRYKPIIKINCKSDVWSLGCILYNLVYGRTPFQHIANVWAKLQAIVNPEYEIEFPEYEDPSLVDAVKKCLIRNPKERPSVQELLLHPSVTRNRETSSHVASPEDELDRIKDKLSQIQQTVKEEELDRMKDKLSQIYRIAKELCHL